MHNIYKEIENSLNVYSETDLKIKNEVEIHCHFGTQFQFTVLLNVVVVQDIQCDVSVCYAQRDSRCVIDRSR